ESRVRCCLVVSPYCTTLVTSSIYENDSQYPHASSRRSNGSCLSDACRNTRQWVSCGPCPEQHATSLLRLRRGLLVPRSDHRDAFLELQDPHRAARTPDYHEGTEPDHPIPDPGRTRHA